MKADELRELTREALRERLTEIKEEYFNLKFQNATGQLDSYSQLKGLKRDIARIQTIDRERDLGIDREVTEEEMSTRRRKKEAEAEAGLKSDAAGDTEEDQ